MTTSGLVRFALVVIVASLSTADAPAQTAASPLPLLFAKDGDGRVVGQVLDIPYYNGFWPRVVIDVDGIPVLLFMTEYGLADTVAMFSDVCCGPSVYFSGQGCTGPAAVNQVTKIESPIEWGQPAHFGVAGPDQFSGTYKLFRSTTMTPTAFAYGSKWMNGACQNSSGQGQLLPAEEVVPNPLEGFHGPTLNEPDKKWSLAGGTRITPP